MQFEGRNRAMDKDKKKRKDGFCGAKIKQEEDLRMIVEFH